VNRSNKSNAKCFLHIDEEGERKAAKKVEEDLMSGKKVSDFMVCK